MPEGSLETALTETSSNESCSRSRHIQACAYCQCRCHREGKCGDKYPEIKPKSGMQTPNHQSEATYAKGMSQSGIKITGSGSKDVVFLNSSTVYGSSVGISGTSLEYLVYPGEFSHMTPEQKHFSNVRSLCLKLVEMGDKSTVHVVG